METSEVTVADLVEPEPLEPAPIMTVMIDLIATGPDDTNIRVQYPLGKHLIVLGMLKEAAYQIQRARDK